MNLQARLLAIATVLVACGAIGAPDRSHLIAPTPGGGSEGLYLCQKFRCDYTTVDVKTEDWTDQSVPPVRHTDGCTVTWKHSGIEVSEVWIGSKLRWKINPLDTENYYFDPSVGVKLEDDDKNDRRWDLDQEGYDFGSNTFKWFDFNRRPRLGKPTEPDPEKRGIRFDYRVYRERGANGGPGPELCGSHDPVIYNRG